MSLLAVVFAALWAFLQVALHKLGIWFVNAQIRKGRIETAEHAERVILCSVFLLTFAGALCALWYLAQ